MMNRIDELLDEARLLWHAMVRSAERLHAAERVSPGMRAVLEQLLVHGPATVPAIARRRGVSRQHVQALVDALLGARLAAVAPNPRHRRSVLVGLTPGGRRTIERMRRREHRRFASRGLGASAREIGRAAATLRAVRGALERER